MATGTGQRQRGAPEREAEFVGPPAVTVHDAAGAAMALSLAGSRGVLLLSAAGAAGSLGVAWFLAILDAARAARPDVPHIAVLDCGDAPGHALAALRAGLRDLVLAPEAQAFAQIMAAAQEVGGRIRPDRPASLDLGGIDLTRAGGRAKLAAWLAEAG